VDRSLLDAIVLEHLPRLSAALGLHHWEITVGYDSALGGDGPGTIRGECTRLVDYQSAHVLLNPESLADEDAVLTTLRHELFHIVLAPFDLYTSAVERLDLPEVTEGLLERVRDHAIERAIAGLEHMWSGLTQAE
jgi:hypothetical protein